MDRGLFGWPAEAPSLIHDLVRWQQAHECRERAALMGYYSTVGTVYAREEYVGRWAFVSGPGRGLGPPKK